MVQTLLTSLYTSFVFDQRRQPSRLRIHETEQLSLRFDLFLHSRAAGSHVSDIEAVPPASCGHRPRELTMASHRVLSLASRWPGFTSSWGSCLLKPTAGRLSSTETQKIPEFLKISPLERALQDTHGDKWKEMASRRQRSYVKYKEFTRRNFQERRGITAESPPIRLARDDEYDATWHEKVEWWKKELLQQKQAREAQDKTAPEAEPPKSQA